MWFQNEIKSLLLYWRVIFAKLCSREEYLVSGEAPQWMCGRRRPVFPTHPAQGMGWVQLVRHGWAWGNLGRLNAALGMRLTEDVEAKRPRAASTTITAVEWPPPPGYPGSQAACPVLPGSCCCHPPQQAGPQESRKALPSEKPKPWVPGLTHAGHQTLLRGLSDSQGRCECYTRQWMGDTVNREAPHSRGQAVTHSPSALTSCFRLAPQNQLYLCLSALLWATQF